MYFPTIYKTYLYDIRHECSIALAPHYYSVIVMYNTLTHNRLYCIGLRVVLIRALKQLHGNFCMWRDDQPIYKQLKDKVVRLILTGSYKDGDALPSVRTVSAEYHINHLTVSKAYQELVDDMIVEKRRGLGMFVKTDAATTLLVMEKKKFFNDELPALRNRIEELGIDRLELLNELEALGD
ncbi:MAG: GntR family transcriptional regulator [Flavobacteriales bacterium]